MIWSLLLLLGAMLAVVATALAKTSPQQKLLEQRLQLIAPVQFSLEKKNKLKQSFWQVQTKKFLSGQRLAKLAEGATRQQKYLVATITVSCMVFLMFFVLPQITGWDKSHGLQQLVHLVMAMFLSWLLAMAMFWWLQQRRIAWFEAQFPKGLELINRALLSGQALPQAMAEVVLHGPKPVAKVFAEVINQLDLGLQLDQILQQQCRKVPSRHLRFFAIAVSVNQDSGGQLTEVLEKLARAIQAQKVLSQKLKTLTAEPRQAARIVALFPVLVIFGFWYAMPDVFSFFTEDETGKNILLYALISTGTGLLIINRMTRSTG